MKLGIFSVMDFHPDVQASQSDFYQQTIDYAIAADEHGFDSFWVAEHHFSHYGLCPSPSLLLSNIAARTQNIKLGPAVKVLPFHDPVKVAEEYAVLDVLSGGRLEVGVGKGYLEHEYLGHNIQREDSQQRFIEALDIIKALWTGQEVTYQGEHFSLPNPVKLNTLPLQPNGPALSFAGLSAPGFGKVGELGHSIMGIPYLMESLDRLRPALASYRLGLGDGGHDSKNVQATMGVHIHVAKTNALARQQSQEFLTRYCVTRAVGNSKTFDELMEKQLICIGDPDHVTQQLQTMADMGTTRVLALKDFGGMPFELVKSSLDLLAKEVYPALSSD